MNPRGVFFFHLGRSRHPRQAGTQYVFCLYPTPYIHPSCSAQAALSPPLPPPTLSLPSVIHIFYLLAQVSLFSFILNLFFFSSPFSFSFYYNIQRHICDGTDRRESSYTHEPLNKHHFLSQVANSNPYPHIHSPSRFYSFFLSFFSFVGACFLFIALFSSQDSFF